MADERHEWAVRMRRFFDTWGYDLIDQEAVDRLAEHLSLTLRLRALDSEWVAECEELGCHDDG